MPKKTKRTNRVKDIFPLKNILFKIRWDESYVSLAVGVIVVILVAVLGIMFVRSNRTGQTSSTNFNAPVEFEKSEEEGASITDSMNGEKSYTVRAGDTLWSISEQFYKSGYNWVDVAKTNKLSNPNLIEAGKKLQIPNVKAREITVIEPQKQTQKRDISGNSYKVQEGDYLWNIALRAYGDGYSWVKIAKENKLVNPDIIYPNIVLKIPR